MSTGYTAADEAPLAPTGKEIEAMEARRDALRDVYGTTDLKSFEEGEAMLATARKQVDEALQMLRGEDDVGEAFNEAMEKSPYLVEIESNPIRYLRASDYDPWAAANNIAMYWKIRKEFFGGRAFLPMVVSGKGAMTEEDVEALKCGGTCILPPESSNRHVFFNDRSRYCSLCRSQDIRARIVFYVLQSAMENDGVMRCGMVITTVIDTDDKKMGSGVHNIPVVKMLKLFKSGAFPIQFRALHIFVLRKRSFMETSVPLWLHALDRWKFLLMRTVVHYSESNEAAIHDLKQYGFLEERTPELLGGTYNLNDEFSKWLKQRLDIEQKRYGAVSVRAPLNEGPQEHSHGSIPTEASLKIFEDLAAAAEKARAEEAKARKRKLDAIYQRNKRENERNIVMRLKEQMNGLRDENAALKAEHDSLSLSMERALVALEAHKKEQEQARLAPSICAGHFRGAAAPMLPPQIQDSPLCGTSIAAVAQHVPQLSSNGGFFSNMLRSLPGFSASVAAPVAPVINSLADQPNMNLALLQRLQASGVRPTNSQLAQQLRVQQQQLLLQQQLQQELEQQRLIRQAELAGNLLGANRPNRLHDHDYSSQLLSLSNPAAAPGNLLRQQPLMSETEKDVWESILRKQQERNYAAS